MPAITIALTSIPLKVEKILRLLAEKNTIYVTHKGVFICVLSEIGGKLEKMGEEPANPLSSDVVKKNAPILFSQQNTNVDVEYENFRLGQIHIFGNDFNEELCKSGYNRKKRGG